MLMENKTYDILKKVALIFLPALATLWLTIGKIWVCPTPPRSEPRSRLWRYSWVPV